MEIQKAPSVAENDAYLEVEGFEGQKVHERNPEGRHTVILVGGITEGIDTQEALSEALASEGYRVLSFDPTTQPAEADPDAPGRQARHHEAKSDQAAAILEQLVGVGEREGEKATLVAHSEGDIFAVNAALEHPEKVDRVMILNGSALFEDSVPRLGARFGAETVRKALTPKKLAQKQQYHGTKALLTNPRDFMGDTFDIANNTDLRENIVELRDKGVKVDAFVGAKDQVFPWRLVGEGVGFGNSRVPAQAKPEASLSSKELDTLHSGSDNQEVKDLREKLVGKRRLAELDKQAEREVEALWNGKKAEVVPDEIVVDSISSYFTSKEGRGGQAKQHKFASRWAGHDQPIIYPEQTARLVRSIIEPETVRMPNIFKPSETWTMHPEQFGPDSPIRAAVEEMNAEDPKELIAKLRTQVDAHENGTVIADLRGENPDEYSDKEAIVYFNPYGNGATDNMLVRAETIRRTAKHAEIKDADGKYVRVVMIASDAVSGSDLNTLTAEDRAMIRSGELGPIAREQLKAVTDRGIGRAALFGFSMGADMAVAGARKEYQPEGLEVHTVVAGDPSATEDRGRGKLAMDFLGTGTKALGEAVESGGIDAQKAAMPMGGIPDLLQFGRSAASRMNLDTLRGMGHDTFMDRVKQILGEQEVGTLVVGYGSESKIARPKNMEQGLQEIVEEFGEDALTTVKVEGGSHAWGDMYPLLARFGLSKLSPKIDETIVEFVPEAEEENSSPKRREAIFNYVREKIRKFRGEAPEGETPRSTWRKKLAATATGALLVGAVGYGAANVLMDDDESEPEADRTEQTTTTITEDVQAEDPGAPVVVEAPERSAQSARDLLLQKGATPEQADRIISHPRDFRRLVEWADAYTAETGKSYQEAAEDFQRWVESQDNK